MSVIDMQQEYSMTQGFQVTFFTQQDRRIHGTPVGVWLLDSARELGIRGGTLLAASEGLGHKGKLHSAHFLELADQPQEVIFVVTQEELHRLMALLAEQEGRIFFVKMPVEFGAVGKGSDE